MCRSVASNREVFSASSYQVVFVFSVSKKMTMRIDTRKVSYQALNRLSGPRTTVGRWTSYTICTVADITFLALAFVSCKGEPNPPKLWVIVKSIGAAVFRFLMLFEYLDHHITFVELRKHLTIGDHRFKSQMTDPFVPRYDYASLIAGTFEAACALGTTNAIANATNVHKCHLLILAAVGSSTLTYLKWIVSVYKSCLRCRRRFPR